MKLRTYIMITGTALCLTCAGIVQMVKAQTLSDSIARDVTPWYGEDQSTYPDQNNRRGVIVRRIDFGVTSGAADANLGTPIPDGTLITEGWAYVHTAVDPLPTNSAFSVEAAGDIVATGTNGWASTGVKDLVPADTVATSVEVLDAVTYLTWDITGVSAPTQGVIMVYLDVLQVNP